MARARQAEPAGPGFSYYEALGRMATSVAIFLYRDDGPRPDRNFSDWNVDASPNGPYYRQAFYTPENFCFDVFTDRYLLQGDKPLWYHIVASGTGIKPISIISFHKSGGGGRGVEKQKSEGRNQNETRNSEVRNQKVEERKSENGKGKVGEAKRKRGRPRKVQASAPAPPPDLPTSLPPDHGSSAADLATLRELFESLRTFPEGWSKHEMLLTKDHETEEANVSPAEE